MSATTPWDCCSWPKRCWALPPHVSVALALPSLPPVPSQRRKSRCSWSPACHPAGDSWFHPRAAWLWVERLPELEKCAESCSVICSTGTWSWLEPNLGSRQQILSNSSPARAWLKRQMQNGLCTIGLAQLWLGEARSETALPTGTLGPVDPQSQGVQSRS